MTNREIAEATFAAMAAGDLDRMLELIHPDVEFTSLIAEVEGGDFQGHEGVRQWWEYMVGSLGGVRFRLEEYRDIGPCAILKVRTSGEAAGVAVDQAMWQAVELRDGKVSWWNTVRTEDEALAAVRARTR